MGRKIKAWTGNGATNEPDSKCYPRHSRETHTRAFKRPKEIGGAGVPFTERATGHATDLRGSMRGTGPMIVIHDRARILSFNHRMKLNRTSSIIEFLVENVSLDVPQIHVYIWLIRVVQFIGRKRREREREITGFRRGCSPVRQLG